MIKSSCILFIVLLVAGNAFAQGSYMNDKLIKIPSLTIKKIDNPFYKEYYEIMMEQPLDHKKPKGTKFKQRLALGYNDPALPTIMETEEFSMEAQLKPGYVNELGYRIQSNLLVVEQRYFGQSVPEKPDWIFLTMEQSAGDCHAVHEFFKQFLTGKWLLMSSTRGGQMALNYKMKFPGETEGALIYSTPVRAGFEDARLETFFAEKAKTDCGRYIETFQKELLERKKELVPVFEKFVTEKKITFTHAGLDAETVFECSVLYFPFLFWQSGAGCDAIPMQGAPANAMVKGLFTVVPPRFFSDENIQRLEASAYMFYNELGGYEYNTKPFESLLKKKDYSNKLFLPPNATVKFNGAYLQELNNFIKKSRGNLLFIYGENDPWAALQPVLKEEGAIKKMIVTKGSGKSRLTDLAAEQNTEAFNLVCSWLGIDPKAQK